MSSTGETMLRQALSSLETLLKTDAESAVERILVQFPELEHDENAVVELIYTEYLIRDEHGQSQDPATYYERFPQHKDRLSNLLLIHSALESGEFVSGEESTKIRSATVLRLEVGDRIGPFELFELLGSGGMGLVYRARQTGLDRIVALKVLRRSIHEPQELRRFIAEAKTAAQLQHPHIVQVFETDIFDSYPYIALEFVAGGSLEEQLRQGSMGGRAAALLLCDLAGAIQYAHEQGVIHRDLKPSNVLLSENGVAKVADFGLAKREFESADESPVTLTQTGALLGTPSYMAPEQVRGDKEEIGPLTDVYGLGAVLYQSITGQPPFAGQTAIDILQNIQTIEPVAPRRLNPQLPREVETICLKCLEKDPRRRYGSAAALSDDLRRFLEGRPIVARPSNVFSRSIKLARRTPVVSSLLALLAVSLVLGFLVTTWLWRHSEQARVGETEQRLEATQSLYRQQAALAKREVGAGNAKNAMELLARMAPEERGWEWDYLKGRCDATAVDYDAKAQIQRLEYSPDGRRIGYCTGGWLGKTPGGWAILDSSTMQLICSGQAEEATIYDLAFSHDGNQLATAEGYVKAADTLKIWNTETGELMDSFSGEKVKFAFSVACHPDGKRVAIGGGGGIIEVWNLETRQLEHTFHRHDQSVFSLDFHPEGERLASASRDGTIRVWNLTTGEHERLVFDGADMRDVIFSPDGRRLAHSGYEQEILVWDFLYDPPRSERIFVSNDHPDDTRFSGDGRFLVGVGPNLMVHDLHLEQMRSRRFPSTSPNGVHAVDVHPERDIVVGGDTIGGIKRLRMNGENTELNRGTAAHFVDSAVDPTGRFIAVAPTANNTRPGVRDFRPHIYDRKNLNAAPVALDGMEGWSRDIEYSVDGTRIAVVDDNHCIYEFDGESRRLRRKYSLPNSAKPIDIAYLDSNDLVCLNDDGIVTVHVGKEGEQAATESTECNFDGVPSCLELASERAMFAIGGMDGMIRWFGHRSDPEGYHFSRLGEHRAGDSKIEAIAFSPSDQMLAACTQQAVFLFAIKGSSLKPLWSIETIDGVVNEVAFHPAGNRLVVVSAEAERVRILNTANGAAIIEFAIENSTALDNKFTEARFLPSLDGSKSATLFVQSIRNIDFWPQQAVGINEAMDPVAWRITVDWHLEQAIESILGEYDFGAQFHSRRAMKLLETPLENIATGGPEGRRWMTHQLLVARCVAAYAKQSVGQDDVAETLLAEAVRDYHIAYSRKSNVAEKIKGAIRNVAAGRVMRDSNRIVQTGDNQRELAAFRIATLLPTTRIVDPEQLMAWGESAVRRDSESWRYWLLHGIARYELGELTGADESFRCAGACLGADADEWNSAISFWLAILCSSQNEAAKAAEWIKRGDEQIRLSPELSLPLWQLKLQERAHAIVEKTVAE